jgi:hypothetical protein
MKTRFNVGDKVYWIRKDKIHTSCVREIIIINGCIYYTVEKNIFLGECQLYAYIEDIFKMLLKTIIYERK